MRRDLSLSIEKVLVAGETEIVVMGSGGNIMVVLDIN